VQDSAEELEHFVRKIEDDHRVDAKLASTIAAAMQSAYRAGRLRSAPDVAAARIEQASIARNGKAAKRAADPTLLVIESVVNANNGTKERSAKEWRTLVDRELEKKKLPPLKPRSDKVSRYLKKKYPPTHS
jgi:hypothetical protein